MRAPHGYVQGCIGKHDNNVCTQYSSSGCLFGRGQQASVGGFVGGNKWGWGSVGDPVQISHANEDYTGAEGRITCDLGFDESFSENRIMSPLRVCGVSCLQVGV